MGGGGRRAESAGAVYGGVSEAGIREKEAEFIVVCVLVDLAYGNSSGFSMGGGGGAGRVEGWRVRFRGANDGCVLPAVLRGAAAAGGEYSIFPNGRGEFERHWGPERLLRTRFMTLDLGQMDGFMRHRMAF